MNNSEVEKYLKEYWYAKKAISRLLLELDVAKTSYERNIDSTVVSSGSVNTDKHRKPSSPTERAAVIASDQYKADVDMIEEKLNRERCTVDTIERIIYEAGLARWENEYVRMRYMENRSARYISMILGKSERTCRYIRESALGKIGGALRANMRRGKANGQGKGASA